MQVVLLGVDTWPIWAQVLAFVGIVVGGCVVVVVAIVGMMVAIFSPNQHPYMPQRQKKADPDWRGWTGYYGSKKDRPKNRPPVIPRRLRKNK